tara:strand:+ start:27 stop:446 length:420 start_codon:yes stop_codon:yes gene_type:complete
MELTQFVLPLFVAIEIIIILALYRFILRDWIIQKWEAKMDEEGWLVIRLEPVIDEIEDRMHDKLEQFQSSFFGSIGAMTKKAQNLDPMNNLRKAAKSGDWPSMMLEYMANKAGLQGVLPPKEDENTIQTVLPKSIKGLK